MPSQDKRLLIERRYITQKTQDAVTPEMAVIMSNL